MSKLLERLTRTSRVVPRAHWLPYTAHARHHPRFVSPLWELSPPRCGFSTRTAPRGRYDDPWERMRRPPKYQTIEHRQQYQHARPILTSKSLKVYAAVGAGGAMIFYFSNLETVPFSGRRRFNFVSAETAESQSLQAYHQILQQEGQQGKILPEWDRRVKQVKRVLDQLIEGGKLGNGATGDGTGWEVHVIEDPNTQNAFVLPGGKVFVYSGILPICKGDDGLAAVLGHEIAHNIAQHSAERMSSMLPLTLLSYAFLYLDATGITLGLGQYLGHLLTELIFSRPSSRQQESEADYIGLLLMAQGCYDPRAAVGLWQRMDIAQRDAPPEWLSTHPSNENRVTKIQEWLPKAEAAREASECAVTRGFADDFNRSTVFKPFW